jgi:predicted AlkP superfamily pyrophosphatase or phosphodiesterase
MTRLAFGAAAGLAALVAAAPGVRPQQAVRDGARPRLVVILVVDQLRADYIERFGHEWTGGLRRLLDSGAWFSQAAYPYFNTVTCVGHATIATGSLPSTHGMILNDWWDRTAARRVSCTADEMVSVVSHGADLSGRGDSAWRLQVPTLADELRAQLGGSPRVMTFSLKARSAIGLAGHGGDAVVWFDGRGAFVTSTAFSEWPVSAVAEFVQANAIPADVGRTWERLLAADRYLFESPAVGAKPDPGATPAFPHPLAPAGAVDRSFYTRWQESPYSDAYLARMALHVARALGAGADDRTDVLGVSFSALDLVGHNYGPRSHEVQDVLLRVDRTIGGLLDGLDALVGTGRYVVALSADHGVAPIPEYASTVGLDAGRRTSAALTQAIEEVLRPLGPEPHVAATLYTDVYLTGGTWQQIRERPELIRALKERLLALDGISAVFTRDEMETTAFPDGSIGGRMAHSYFAGRSGDLLVAQRPYWIASSDATTHGTGYAYDARVPIVFMGEPFVPGEYLSPATPADVAPTLAHLTGVTLPHAQGRVLREALRRVR